jgi:uncharacterized membrane protein YgcG
MKKILFYCLVAFSVIFAGCDNPRHRRIVHRVHHTQPVHPLVDGSYAYYNPNDHYWYYVWLNNNNNSFSIDRYVRYTESPQERGILADTSRPMLEKQVDQELTINPDGTANGEIDFLETATMETDNIVSTVEEMNALATWESSGGSVITEDVVVDSDNGAVSGDSGSMDSNSSDSGSSDSGSSDSGGGDSGGSGD